MPGRPRLRRMQIPLIQMLPAGSSLRAGALCSSGWSVDSPWHRHDMHQLLYAFEGALVVEGRNGRYKIPRQFAAWIPAGAAHRTTIQKVASGSIYISPSLLPMSADTPRVIVAPLLMREMVMHAMRWPLDRSADDTTSVAYFECFARLCAEWIGDEVKMVLPVSDDRRIAAIMEFTRNHIASVALSDVCRALGMSERSLRRQFTSNVGMSWEEYRQRLRIHLALHDLDTTNKPIGAIAASNGYENQAAFARAFRAIIGVSPTDYRDSRNVRRKK
jgi:AraC-like DNA-binding protein